MTSALGGGRGVHQKEMRVLISCVSVTVTGGVKNPKILWMSYVQRGTKRYVNLAKQDPGKARQSS